MKERKKKWGTLWKGLLISALWLAVWEIAHLLVGSSLLLPSPLETLQAFVSLCQTREFYLGVFGSLFRISLGFLSGLILGTAMAFLGWKLPFLPPFLAPAVSVMKATPVASFIILANLWLQSDQLVSVISGLMVFPLVYRSVLEGLQQLDQDLLEMGKSYRFSPWKVFRYLILPSLLPAFRSSFTVGLGFAWKAGVAAEVIVLVPASLGEQLYQSKVSLETPTLFAITAGMILLSVLLEKLVLLALNERKPAEKMAEKQAPARGKKTFETPCWERAESSRISPVGLEQITFSFSKKEGETPLLESYSLSLPTKGISRLEGPSGWGKTTVLRLLAGLLIPAKGQVRFWDGRVQHPGRPIGQTGAPVAAMVFQEDRLIPSLSLQENVALVLEGRLSKEEAEHKAALWLSAVGLSEDLGCLAREASGGMKRRSALARGLAFANEHPGLPILLDEPFTGVDEENKKRLYPLLQAGAKEHGILLVTHLEEEAAALLAGE